VGDLDRKITWICQKLVGPGDTVMDIGANIGLVTLWLSYLVGESGKVHAFEPNPKLQEMIEKALHRNRRSNVIVHRMALGSKDGTMELYIPQGNSGEGSLIRNRARKDCNIVSVPVYTLSSVMAKEKFDKVRLIKIDVEGFEEEVLRGASEFFEKVRPETLLFEQNAKFNGPISHQPVIRLMHDLDYGFFSIQKCKLRMHLRRFYPDRDKRNNGNDLLAAHRSIYESIASLVGAQE
jgi:FkbM family methyltransferase